MRMMLRGYNELPKMISFETSTIGWRLVPNSWIRHFAYLTLELIHKFCDFYMFPFSSLCLYNFLFHLHIYLQHRNYRTNTSVRNLLNSPVLLFFFIQKFTKFGNSVAFFMPSFSALIRVQSNPGIKRTPRLQKMAYYNLITVSDRLHNRRSRVGVSKLQRTNEKQ